MSNQSQQSAQPATSQPASTKAPARQVVQPQQAVQPQASGPIVLLIEDDPLLIKMYKTKFEAEGFRVLTAGDGEIGLKMALEQKIDFIILDVMMPKISGLDVLAKLKQNPKGQAIPVIVLSNLAEQEKAQKALQLGAKEFLVKANLTPSQVVAKVRQYLGK